MSIREEQCNKVCRTLDDVLANRPTERDSLIIAVRKAFESLEQLGNSEPLPSAQPEPKRGKWERHYCKDGNPDGWQCDKCKEWYYFGQTLPNFCPNCGADMREVTT